MQRLICAVLVFVAYSFAQETGPFGLKAGMTRKQVEQIVGAKAVISEHVDDITYSTVPEPYPLFEEYILTFSRKYGLVEVQGSAFHILDDRSGSSTRSKCEDIHSTLSKKYGKPHQSDECELKAKTECTVPSENSRWEIFSSPRPDKVDTVSLSASLWSITKNERGESVLAGCHDPQAQWRGTIMLIYMFADYSKYQEEVKSTL
jgi:hypothetical protein